MQIPSILNQIKKIVQEIINQKIMPADQRGIYESEDVVRNYAPRDFLYKPETTILDNLRKRLPSMNVLDIGVGAGRTTTHFGYLAKEYIGIDCSNKMIRICLSKFQNCPQKISFLTADARKLPFFKDHTFDFVLFSFNGIDIMNHEERIAILREIRRLVKSGGYFCFSTNNWNSLLERFSIQLSRHPLLLAWRTCRLMQMRLLTKREAWTIIRSYSGNQQHLIVDLQANPEGRVKLYHITPVEQIRQLSEFGFSDTKIYSIYDGREIKNPIKAMDGWVYFLSKAP